MTTALARPELVAELRAAGCVFAEEEAELLLSTAESSADLESMVARRVAGVPLEVVLGWAEFCGLRIAVDPGVFVPRRRTEHLVATAVAGRNPDVEPRRPPVVVDLCCGTGAVGAAIAESSGAAELYAVDVEPAAVACARRNLEPLGGKVFQGDLYEPLPENLRGRIDVLVANAPYVPTDAIETMPPEARIHEPRVTLDGGADGLDILRRVAAEATSWLSPGGHLLVETGERQASLMEDAIRGCGLSAEVSTCAELGATVVVGTSPG